MHEYTADVAISGERHQVVRKHKVTAAEIMVLQAIHGSGSVTDIKVTNSTGKRQHRDEMDRLMKQYGRTKISQGGDRKPVLTVLFNVHSPQLPVDVKEAGIKELFLAEADRKPQAKKGPKSGAKRSTKSKATKTEDTGAEGEQDEGEQEDPPSSENESNQDTDDEGLMG